MTRYMTRQIEPIPEHDYDVPSNVSFASQANTSQQQSATGRAIHSPSPTSHRMQTIGKHGTTMRTDESNSIREQAPIEKNLTTFTQFFNREKRTTSEQQRSQVDGVSSVSFVRWIVSSTGLLCPLVCF
jgi:hypothetical protein